jgi:hypothetical protein
MKQVLGPQRSHESVLHEIVRGFGIARQRPSVAPQRRYRRFDILVKRAQPTPQITAACQEQHRLFVTYSIPSK